MNYLAENAVPIWAAGAVLLTLALVVFFQTRDNRALAAGLGIALIAAALLITERLIETPREAVARTLDELAAAIEANDIPGVLAFIAPQAKQVRTDAETLMPLVIVKNASVPGTPNIVVDETANPATATAKCQGLIKVVVKQNHFEAPYMDRVTIQFVKSGDRWLIDDYKPEHDWRRELR